MVARGSVQNGVVVLDAGVRLPEGQEVTVPAPDEAAARRESEKVEPQSRGSRDEAVGVSPVPTASGLSHSTLDIPPVSLGPVLRPFTSDGDLLDEMLEGQA